VTNLAVIPARGGSKRIPKKNVALLSGRPLIYYTITAALQSHRIDRVIVSTENEEISEISRSFGAEVLARPDCLAADTSLSIDVIKNVVSTLAGSENYRADTIVLLQPTSPLRTSQHIDCALDMFLASSADSLVSTVRVPHSFQPQSLMVVQNGYLTPYLGGSEMSTSVTTSMNLYARNGAAIYIFSHECLITKNSLFGDTTIPFEMTPDESIDINEPWDLQLCESIMRTPQ